jgi:hypothetical protein
MKQLVLNFRKIMKNIAIRMRVAFISCAILNRFNFPIGYSFQVSSKDFIN